MANLLKGVDLVEKGLAQNNSQALKSEYFYDREDDPVQDGVHDGLEFPTGEEKITLRRVADTIPWNAYRKRLSVSYHPNLTRLTFNPRPDQ